MEYTPNSRRLSEISHLFLSDVRKQQTGDAPPPARTPPGMPAAGGFRGDLSVDLTAEEFAGMLRPAALDGPVFKPARVVLAHHLGDAMHDRVRDLAATLGAGRPMGVIFADSASVRISRIDLDAEPSPEETAVEPMSAQRVREVMVELDEDVAGWLIVLPDPRSAAAQSLLKQTPDWTLLSGVDHDTVVSSYRTLKGLCGDARPAVSVSIFGAVDAVEVDKTCRKLGGVCEQFLKIAVEFGPAVVDDTSAVETCLYDALAETDDHWPILAGLVAGACRAGVSSAPTPTATVLPVSPKPAPPSGPGPVMRTLPTVSPVDTAGTIFDLVDADASPAGILRSVVRGGTTFVDSPVHPPMLPDAVVAVDRDRRLTLLAVARPGLGEFRSVATAVRWMNENRALIAMAVPQLAIDPTAEPRLHVLVDHADAAADVLQPLLATGSVTVAAYRRVNWAGRAGLLLEAA